jgi:hypothetical protein
MRRKPAPAKAGGGAIEGNAAHQIPSQRGDDALPVLRKFDFIFFNSYSLKY